MKMIAITTTIMMMTIRFTWWERLVLPPCSALLPQNVLLAWDTINITIQNDNENEEDDDGDHDDDDHDDDNEDLRHSMLSKASPFILQ